MAYPEKLLGEDEEIVHELRPHWRTLILPALLLLIVAAGLGFALSTMSGTGLVRTIGRWAAIGIALVLLAGWVVRPFFHWYSTHYVLTNRRIIVRMGVLRREGRDMPLARVNDVSFRESAIDRIFRCGTLMVESGSEQGQLVIANVPGVELVQREIYRLHDRDDERRRGLGPNGPGAPSGR